MIILVNGSAAGQRGPEWSATDRQRTCRKADPDRPETSCRDSLPCISINPHRTQKTQRTYRDPEHRTKTMFKSQPSIPVPMTATKMATGAANAARLTSSLLNQQSLK